MLGRARRSVFRSVPTAILWKGEASTGSAKAPRSIWATDRAGPWVFSYGCNRNKGTTWGDATLMECLENPKKLVPGTEIIFAVIKKSAERADLMAYLKRATNE